MLRSSRLKRSGPRWARGPGSRTPAWRWGPKVLLLAGGSAGLPACDERGYVRETRLVGDDEHDLTAAEEVASILMALPQWALSSPDAALVIAPTGMSLAPVKMLPEVLAAYEQAAATVGGYTNSQILLGYNLVFENAIAGGDWHINYYGPTMFIMTRLLLDLPDGIAPASVPHNAIMQFSRREARALSTTAGYPVYALRGPVTFASHGSLESIATHIVAPTSNWGHLLNEFTWLSGAYPRRVFDVCEDRCGTYSASLPCQCDAACAGYNDCCTDIVLCD